MLTVLINETDSVEQWSHTLIWSMRRDPRTKRRRELWEGLGALLFTCPTFLFLHPSPSSSCLFHIIRSISIIGMIMSYHGTHVSQG